MSAALEQVFSEIEKGAEEHLEALWSKKECMQQGEASTETVPQLIGHIEKVEENGRKKRKICGISQLHK